MVLQFATCEVRKHWHTVFQKEMYTRKAQFYNLPRLNKFQLVEDKRHLLNKYETIFHLATFVPW